MKREDFPNLILATTDFRIGVAPGWAWTPDSIDYRGRTLASPSGFYGMALDIGNDRPVGAGHDEGGREEVLDVRIEADGEPIDLQDDFPGGGEIKGDEIVFTKQSNVVGLNVRSILRLRGGVVEAELFGRAERGFSVTKFNAFMFPWLTCATQWLAQTLDGQEIEGIFDNDGHKMNAQIRWCAVYFAEIEVAAISRFSSHDDERAFRHFFNDCPYYHKQYCWTQHDHRFGVGEEFRYTMTLAGVLAALDEWKEKARAVAASLALR